MSRIRFRLSTLVLVALFTMFSVTAFAQETTGSISGTITDASGASVKGAAVTLTNTDRGQDVRTLTTNSAGFYTAPSLPLGTYTVKVTAGGFKSEVVTGLALHELVDLRRIDQSGGSGIFQIQLYLICRDRHGLTRVSHDQRAIHRQRIVHVQR